MTSGLGAGLTGLSVRPGAKVRDDGFEGAAGRVFGRGPPELEPGL